MPSIGVDPEQLRTAATKLRVACEYAQKASDHATEADPDWWMWGLPGLVFSPVYFALADGWRELLSNTSGAIEGVCGRLDGTSGSYEDIEATIDEDLAKLLTRAEEPVGDYARSSRQNIRPQ